jgi:hypothetical protein
MHDRPHADISADNLIHNSVVSDTQLAESIQWSSERLAKFQRLFFQPILDRLSNAFKEIHGNLLSVGGYLLVVNYAIF